MTFGLSHSECIYRAPIRARDLDVPACAGAIREDRSPDAHAVGIVHVRDATWLARAFQESEVPRAVARTFARGGRNFQRMHDDEAERMTAEIWLREPGVSRSGAVEGAHENRP